jgi:ferredoxin
VRISVDRDRCVGSGQCVAIAASVFDQDEVTGTVRLLDDTPPALLSDDVHEAVEICPARAISLVEE